MAYGYCYSSAPTSCSGKAQLGTRNLRDTMDILVPDVGDYGIYNCRPSSGGGGLSRHANGTAWDAATIKDGGLNLPLNLKLGDFFVAAAQDLGTQRVICWGPRFDGTIGAREWDARDGERKWEYYTGPSSHQDHCHTELCWRASQELTVAQVEAAYHRYWPQEDDMFEQADKERLERVEAVLSAILVYLGSKDPDAVGKAVGRGDILSDVDFKIALARAEGFSHTTGKPPAAPVTPDP